MDNTNPIFCSIAAIEENIREKLTVESLADSIHLSKYHYQRMFREIVGDSVMRYVTGRRISLAATELAWTDASILEIALKYGYDSHEGFTRSFRAHMGVSPKEYRKYHGSISSPKTQKERSAMFYSKTTDEIIRELNHLIVQSKETAAYTRRSKETGREPWLLYSGFWDAMAAGADAMADGLSAILGRITDIPQRPDEISARFLIVKAIEDATFKSHAMAFQARLMAARAKPEHRAAFELICDKYDALARNAQMKVDRIVGFFRELSALIFQDMRENVGQKLLQAAAKGRDVAAALTDGADLPYAYIADEINGISQEISSMAPADVNISMLEDGLFRLDLVVSAAEFDMMRMPSHQPLLDGILAFREQLREAVLFFQNLPLDVVQGIAKPEEGAALEYTVSKKYSDLAFQTHILLFYLKGEIEKLGQRLDEGQKAAFASICARMDAAIQLARRTEDEVSPGEIAEILQKVHGSLMAEAERLGVYGNPVWLIAEEILHLAGHIAAA